MHFSLNMFWPFQVKNLANDNFAVNSDEQKSFLEPGDGDSTDGESVVQFPLKKASHSYYGCRIFCYAVVAALAAFGLVTIAWEIKEKLTGDDYTYTDCGSTPAEARLRGCHFEPMQRAWIPPECWFNEPAEEYDVFRDRMWYLEKNLTIPVSPDVLEAGEEPRIYTRYWHDEHCAYVLRKLALAVSTGKKMINSVPASIIHSNHCSRTITNRIKNSYNASFLEGDHSKVQSLLLFDTCVPLKVVASQDKAVARYIN